MGEERRFTVDEAEGELGELRRTLEAIRGARKELLESSESIRGRVAADGGGVDGAAYWESLAALRDGIEAISQRGIILRDPETGVVDFPAERDGEPIFLCWRLGEEHVGFWHDTETGFSGRKPI